MSFWKNSTSLILATRNGLKSNIKLDNNNCDYNVLSLKRHKKSSFMPGAYVFPGGMTEPADSDLKWKHLYSAFGFNEESYQSLIPRMKSRPMIFSRKNDELPREISLRIAVIRETFEECGVLLCKRRFDSKTEWAQHLNLPEDDIKAWQNKVQANAMEFYEMCEKFKCLPDLWSLHEWNVWLTPTVFGKKRFETVFFLAGLEQVPETSISPDEIEELKWEQPLNLLQPSKIFLPPPQHYELSKLVNFNDLDSLIDFAVKRSKIGVCLHFPVMSQLKDGFVLLLPGDSRYPSEVSKTDQQILDNSETTILEFRQTSVNLNRVEVNTDENKKIVISNYKGEDGHLLPHSSHSQSKL